MGVPYCEKCGFWTCQCERGSSEPRSPSVLEQNIQALINQNDRARNRLSHYAAALSKVWNLLDDVCNSPEDDDDYSLSRKLQFSVYDEAVAMRRSIGLLLQGEPWDGDNDPIQELLAMRRELHKEE